MGCIFIEDVPDEFYSLYIENGHPALVHNVLSKRQFLVHPCTKVLNAIGAGNFFPICTETLGCTLCSWCLEPNRINSVLALFIQSWL